MERLLALARTLRVACPWDRAQTLRSYRHCLVEEAQEVALAVERGDVANLQEELGDALFTLGFLVNLAAEQGAFTFDDVVEGAHAKLVRRHPHVFGDVLAATPEEAIAAFERAKAAERETERTATLCGASADGV